MSAELQQGLCDLCLLLYTQLSNVEPQEGPTLTALLSFSPFESLDYIRQKALELLQYRPESDQFPPSEDLSTLHKLEKALQKAENDTRNHIKVEQQLRLHIESLQAKFDEDLKAKEDKIGRFKQIIDQLKREKGGRERRYAVMDIGEMRGKGGLEGCWTDRKEESREILQFCRNNEESERIQQLMRRIAKLEHQVHKYKSAYYARDQAYRDISQKLAAVRSSKHLDFKPRHTLKQDAFDRSSSREAYNRAFTPIPVSLTAAKAHLTHSHSAKRTKSRPKPHETD